MALVAYDNSDSDSSVYDDTDEISTASVNKVTDSVLDLQSSNSQETSNIFKSLPPTKQKSQPVEEEDDEFLRKKAPIKQKAKITVPSLNDFKDIESHNPNNKPKVNNEKKSSLLSMLPEPRNAVKSTTSSFIPNILKQKSKSTNIKSTISTPRLGEDYSDDDSENEDTDFFSINKKHELPEIDESALSSLSTVPEVPRNPVENVQTDIPVGENVFENEQENVGTVETTELDDEAIRQLCGSRGRRKKEDIQILHINQEEVLAEAQEIYRKGLLEDTSKRVSVKRKGNEPTNQQRRKHQITYLAHQAKVNEVELQNQWASSRMSRRKTQAKYGF